MSAATPVARRNLIWSVAKRPSTLVYGPRILRAWGSTASSVPGFQPFAAGQKSQSKHEKVDWRSAGGQDWDIVSWPYRSVAPSLQLLMQAINVLLV